MEADDSGLAVTAALEIQQGQLRFGRAWPQLAHRLGLDPGLAGAGPSELAGGAAGRAPAGFRTRTPEAMDAAMTALLIIALVLAVWLAFPSPRAAGQRTRRALQGTGTGSSAADGQPRSRRRGARREIRPLCAVGDPQAPDPSQ